MRRADPRPLAGSGLDAALDLLPPPFAAGATHDVVPLAAGLFSVEGPRRRPALLVRLRRSLAADAVVVRGQVDGHTLPPVVFAAYTPAGCLLPLHVPELPPGTDGTGSFAVAVQVWHLVGGDSAGAAHDDEAVVARTEPGGPSALPDAEAEALVEAVVLDGTLARLMLLAGLEKQRLLTAGREVAAGRHVGLARACALDAQGADLGVPRLASEADDAYRARLAIYSSWRLATPQGFAAALNGPGPDDAHNAGLPATVGVSARFRIVDAASPLALAVRLVEVDGPVPLRERFAALLRGGLLLDLDSPASPELPAEVQSHLEDVRAVLGAALTRDGTDATRHLSRLAASCLARAVRLLEALTGDGSLTLVRAWVPDPDSRHELGLGVTLERLGPSRLDAAATAARAAAAQAAAGQAVDLPGGPATPETVAAVLAARPRDGAADPLGAWLFEAAGIATATAADATSVHVSPLPTFGLVVEGPAQLPTGGTGQFAARLRQDQSTGRHVLVDEAWGRARAPLSALGGSDPLSPDALRSALEALAAAGAPLPPALGPLAGVGLAPALPGELAARILDAYDLDLLAAVPVADDPAGLAADSPEAQQLRERMVARSDALTGAGFHSVRVLPAPGGGTLLLAGLSVLPGGANRPGQAPPAAYRWYVTELPAGDSEQAGPLRLTRSAGSRAAVRARRPGLALVVCVAYLRRGLADPYEVRIEMPGDEVLTLDQYGYVMNLLEALCPLGIEINTFDLRRSHVSVDGGPPTFLSSRVSRSYTRFRRRRAGGTDRHPDSDPPRR